MAGPRVWYLYRRVWPAAGRGGTCRASVMESRYISVASTKTLPLKVVGIARVGGARAGGKKFSAALGHGPCYGPAMLYVLDTCMLLGLRSEPPRLSARSAPAAGQRALPSRICW